MAETFIKRFRLFLPLFKIFKQEVEKVEDKSKTDTVERCLWKESHKKY